MLPKRKMQVLYTDNSELFSNSYSAFPEWLVGQGRKWGERQDSLGLFIPLQEQ
jgi:hypothetical protein